MKEKTTWSPLAMPLTPSPTSATTPAASCPSTRGSGSAMVPLTAERSEWQTPQAPIFTITSPRLGGSTAMLSTTTGLLSSRQSTARANRDDIFLSVYPVYLGEPTCFSSANAIQTSSSTPIPSEAQSDHVFASPESIEKLEVAFGSGDAATPRLAVFSAIASPSL